MFSAKRLRLIFHAKSYDFRKYQVFDSSTAFWTFLANFHAKSDVIGLNHNNRLL